MGRKLKNVLLILIILTPLALLQGCATTPDTEDVPGRIFPVDQNTAWQAVLTAIKDYPIKERNREGGVIKTAWKDNTKDMNFTDAFERGDTMQAARFKLVVNVFPGSFKGRTATQVTIRKTQIVEGEMLEGWKKVQTDNVIEKVILYRVGRILINEKRLELLHTSKKKEEEKEALGGMENNVEEMDSEEESESTEEDSF